MMNSRSNYTLADVLPFLSNVKRKANGEADAACPFCESEGGHHLHLKQEGNMLLINCLHNAARGNGNCTAEFKDYIRYFKQQGAVPTGGDNKVDAWEIKANTPVKPVKKYNAFKDADVKLEITYEYKNPDGSIAFYRERYKWQDGHKEFFPFTLVNGGKKYGRPKGSIHLYNLDKLAAADAAQTLYIVEGEKCADALTSAGFLATTTDTGAKAQIKFTDTDIAVLSKFINIVILPDNDEAGRKYVKAFDEFNPFVLPMTAIWAGCPDKGDIADYIEQGHDISVLLNYKEYISNSIKVLSFSKDDMLKSDKVCREIWKVKDDMARRIRLNEFMELAKEWHCKSAFEKTWNAFCVQKAREDDVGERHNKTKFPEQGKIFGNTEIDCLDWHCNSIGVYKIKEIDASREYAFRTPVVPTAVVKNVDDNTEKIQISYYDNKTWHHVVVNADVATTQTKITVLRNLGVPITSSNAKSAVTFIDDVITANPVFFIKKDGISRYGWYNGEFAPFTDKIIVDVPPSFNSLQQALENPAGTAQDWLDTILPALKKHEKLRCIFAASLGSTLLEPLGQLSFVFHLWGGSGNGKTVALKIAASVWGNPEMGRMTGSLDATQNAILNKASILKNIPFCGDESQTIKNRWNNYDNLIMRVCEGLNRERMTKDLTQTAPTTWKCAFLFTGEEPIISIDSGGGTVNRVIEACLPGGENVMDNAPVLADFVKEHYGTIGRLFIEALKGYNKHQLKEEFETLVKIMRQEGRTTEKQAASAAIIMLGWYLFAKLIVKDEWLLYRETVETLQEMCKETAAVDVTERAKEFIIDWVNQNNNRFSQSADWSEQVRGECYGAIVNGKYYVIKTVLVKAMKENNFNFEACKVKWSASGFLKKNSCGRYQYQTSVSGIKGTFIVLDFSTIADLDKPM